jgi:hypothetical protein
LQIADADLSVNGMLKGSVVYSEPVDDPFFAAHKPWSHEGWQGPLYISDFVATIFACKEQVQHPDTAMFRQMNAD